MLRAAILGILASLSQPWSALPQASVITSQCFQLRNFRSSGVRRQQRVALKRRNQKRSRR